VPTLLLLLLLLLVMQFLSISADGLAMSSAATQLYTASHPDILSTIFSAKDRTYSIVRQRTALDSGAVGCTTDKDLW